MSRERSMKRARLAHLRRSFGDAVGATDLVELNAVGGPPVRECETKRAARQQKKRAQRYKGMRPARPVPPPCTEDEELDDRPVVRHDLVWTFHGEKRVAERFPGHAPPPTAMAPLLERDLETEVLVFHYFGQLSATLICRPLGNNRLLVVTVRPVNMSDII